MKEISQVIWGEIAKEMRLQAGLLVSMSDSDGDLIASVQSAHGVPMEPFNGSENYAIVDVVKSILEKCSEPHIHGIKKWALANLIKRHGRNAHFAAIAIFAKFETEAGDLIFLGFPENNERDATVANSIEEIVSPLIDHTTSEAKLRYYEAKLDFTEKYTREIGHDLASCVQAIISQLSHVNNGNLTENAMRKKAESACREVKNMYAIAESLDFTLDRNYQVQSRKRFEVKILLSDICEQYQAEADENGIKMEFDVAPDELFILGDRNAIRQCCIHLLVNAIKYSYDNTIIKIRGYISGNEIHLVFSNRGVKLPGGQEANNIWDFGYRSDYAKERHVNGSGIGLYTAKKIVLAHGGRIWNNNRTGKETRFIMAFPK